MKNNFEVKPNPVPTAIKSVSFFRDGQGRCCDRCGTFIKQVALVSLKDGTSISYGSECINKVLNGDNSLQKLWNRNAKALKRYESYLRILSLPVEEMPYDERGYYNRGIYFIADEEGKAFTCGQRYTLGGKEIVNNNGNYCFHPTRVDEHAKTNIFNGQKQFDMRGSGGTCWEAYTLENWHKHNVFVIESKKAWLKFEIERIGAFLARILAKGLVTVPKDEPTVANHAA